jgi:hypothetical protein
MNNRIAVCWSTAAALCLLACGRTDLDKLVHAQGTPAPADAAETGSPSAPPRTTWDQFPRFCSLDGWCGSSVSFEGIWGSAADDVWVVATGVGHEWPLITGQRHPALGWLCLADSRLVPRFPGRRFDQCASIPLRDLGELPLTISGLSVPVGRWCIGTAATGRSLTASLPRTCGPYGGARPTTCGRLGERLARTEPSCTMTARDG